MTNHNYTMGGLFWLIRDCGKANHITHCRYNTQPQLVYFAKTLFYQIWKIFQCIFSQYWFKTYHLSSLIGHLLLGYLQSSGRSSADILSIPLWPDLVYFTMSQIWSTVLWPDVVYFTVARSSPSHYEPCVGNFTMARYGLLHCVCMTMNQAI